MALARALFLQLGVRDVAVSRAFYDELGFAVDERFCSDRTACLVLNELSWVMLVQDGAGGASGGTPDHAPATRGALRLSAVTPQEADSLAGRAAALGGMAEPVDPCVGLDGVHVRAFADPDGHRWELVWLSEARLGAVPPAHHPDQRGPLIHVRSDLHADRPAP